MTGRLLVDWNITRKMP